MTQCAPKPEPMLVSCSRRAPQTRAKFGELRRASSPRLAPPFQWFHVTEGTKRARAVESEKQQSVCASGQRLSSAGTACAAHQETSTRPRWPLALRHPPQVRRPAPSAPTLKPRPHRLCHALCTSSGANARPALHFTTIHVFTMLPHTQPTVPRVPSDRAAFRPTSPSNAAISAKCE